MTHAVAQIVLSASTPCHLQGYPAVEVSGHRMIHGTLQPGPLQPLAVSVKPGTSEFVDPGPVPVTVRPGQNVKFSLAGSDYPSTDAPDTFAISTVTFRVPRDPDPLNADLTSNNNQAMVVAVTTRQPPAVTLGMTAFEPATTT